MKFGRAVLVCATSAGILLGGLAMPAFAQERPSPTVTPIANPPTDGVGVLRRDSGTPILNPDGTEVPFEYAVVLENQSTGRQVRVDTDSAGVPLVPSWNGHVDEEPDANSNPNIVVSAKSVTRDGGVVAFCANYDTPQRFTLYVKNLTTGALAKRPEACGLGGPDPGGWGWMVDAPEIAADGHVIHLRGARYAEDSPYYYYGDTLVFPASGTSRKINGQGSMTRDGKTLFMRIGVHEYGTRDRTGGKVGTYTIDSKRTTTLPGTRTIYGTNALDFDAFTQATYRGRYVAYGDKPIILDRQTGATSDIANVVARSSDFVPEARDWTSPQPRISSDGKTVYTLVENGWVQDEVGIPTSRYVAVTGWEPTATVTVKPVSGASKLHVDVNPNKGSGYWTFKVQQKDSNGHWKTLRTMHKTAGSSETRTLDLGKGTYRVVVHAKYGYQGTNSAEVHLAK